MGGDPVVFALAIASEVVGAILFILGISPLLIGQNINLPLTIFSAVLIVIAIALGSHYQNSIAELVAMCAVCKSLFLKGKLCFARGYVLVVL